MIKAATRWIVSEWVTPFWTDGVPPAENLKTCVPWGAFWCIFGTKVTSLEATVRFVLWRIYYPLLDGRGATCGEFWKSVCLEVHSDDPLWCIFGTQSDFVRGHCTLYFDNNLFKTCLLLDKGVSSDLCEHLRACELCVYFCRHELWSNWSCKQQAPWIVDFRCRTQWIVD